MQALRERQSIVCLWFYFSDDVTLNTFHVPFVIFTSKNDAFLQIHFSPISHNLMEQARLPACQRECQARPLRDYPRQTRKSTWNIRTALGTLFIPDAPLASCPNPSQQGQSRSTGNCSFTKINHRHKSKTMKNQEGKKQERGRKEDASLHLWNSLCKSKAVTALQPLESFAHTLLPNI